MPRWSELSPASRADELDKLGTTIEYLVLDLYDAASNHAALLDELNRCTNDAQRERQLALEWFEDHPQPTERSDWGAGIHWLDDADNPTFRTPNWGNGLPLPRLDVEATEAEVERARGGRPKGSFVGEKTFWVVWKMVLEDDASANNISKVTGETPELEFVNREKAGKIIKAVKANRRAARRAVFDRKPPRGFSATSYGFRLPES